MGNQGDLTKPVNTLAANVLGGTQSAGVIVVHINKWITRNAVTKFYL